MTGAGAWFQVIRPRTAASPHVGSRRIYCFPYGGGASSAFRPLASHLRQDVAIFAASLPGRGSRITESPVDDVRSLASSLADAVSAASERDFIFFGHSMGALLSFEVARELRRRGSAAPAGLVVSGARGPAVAGRGGGKQHHDLPRDELIEHLRKLGGTPPEVLEMPELMELLLPALRADFKICETYRYVSEPPLSVPLMVLSGEGDEEVRPEHAAAWRSETTGECTIRSFPGGHFFIEQQWPEVGRLLNEFLDQTRGKRSEAVR